MLAGVEPWESDVRAVLRVLSAGGQYRVDDLAVGLRLPWNTVRHALAVLVQSGAVVCEGGRYRWTGKTTVTVRVPRAVICEGARRKRGRNETKRRCWVWLPPDEYLRRKRSAAVAR